MNINLSAMRIYKSNSVNGVSHETASTPAKSSVQTAAAEKLDVISISREAADRQFVSQVANGVIADIEAEDAEKLDAIAQAVESGKYFVSSSDLADAILDSIG